MALAEAFYREVERDPVLRVLYPDRDLAPAARHLGWFLVQAWGGPLTYFDHRGHPSMRARHVPFPITTELRDHWLRAMRRAMVQIALASTDHDKLWRWFTAEADALVNVP